MTEPIGQREIQLAAAARASLGPCPGCHHPAFALCAQTCPWRPEGFPRQRFEQALDHRKVAVDPITFTLHLLGRSVRRWWRKVTS